MLGRVRADRKAATAIHGLIDPSIPAYLPTARRRRLCVMLNIVPSALTNGRPPYCEPPLMTFTQR